jgi:hypothetical protein
LSTDAPEDVKGNKTPLPLDPSFPPLLPIKPAPPKPLVEDDLVVKPGTPNTLLPLRNLYAQQIPMTDSAMPQESSSMDIMTIITELGEVQT